MRNGALPDVLVIFRAVTVVGIIVVRVLEAGVGLSRAAVIKVQIEEPFVLLKRDADRPVAAGGLQLNEFGVAEGIRILGLLAGLEAVLTG